jgi:hypothetical protein
VILILEIAVGVALAPVVFPLCILALSIVRSAIQELPYLWEDHPCVTIALMCGAVTGVLLVTQ